MACSVFSGALSLTWPAPAPEGPCSAWSGRPALLDSGPACPAQPSGLTLASYRTGLSLCWLASSLPAAPWTPGQSALPQLTASRDLGLGVPSPTPQGVSPPGMGPFSERLPSFQALRPLARLVHLQYLHPHITHLAPSRPPSHFLQEAPPPGPAPLPGCLDLKGMMSPVRRRWSSLL